MRRRIIIAVVVILFLIVLGYPIGLAVIALTSPTPANVGTGRLVLCPDTPNCVSSLNGEDPEKYVFPLAYIGEAHIAESILLDVLESRPRTQIMVVQGGYIHAEVRSPTMRFIDDLEFRFDESSQEIHVRSAARLGYSDIGENRRRVQAIRETFETEYR